MAWTLARDGWAAAAADIDLDAPRETVQQVEAANGRGRAFHVDVTDGGAIGAVVNNFGWSEGEPFLQNDESLWEQLVAINLMNSHL